jgi:SAM-dependent methyltransferase
MEKSRLVASAQRSKKGVRFSHAFREMGLTPFFTTVLALVLTLFCAAEEFHPVTHRRIAGVMDARGADWLVRPERETEEKPDLAIQAINIKSGSTVADIGAGVGYMTWRLAERVGPSGIVYGEDIQQPMLDMLTKNMTARHLNNVHPVLGTPDDPKLPNNSLDLVLLVDVYHEFSEPEKMLDHLRAALKPQGRIVFLEYRAEDPEVPIRPEHKMTVSQVRAEVQPEGFKFDKTIEVLPQQHIIIFKKP